MVEARGEIFTIPAEKGDVRNLTQLERVGRARSGVVARRQVRLVLQRQVGRVQAGDRSAGRPRRRRARSRCRTRRTTTRRRGRPTRRSCSTPTPTCNVWVMDVASGKAKVVGNDPWMVPERTLNPVVESGLEVGRLLERTSNSLYHAIFVSNVETGETKQVTDGLADAMWPAWDASGKYLWFLASTDFGLRSQWLDMTSYDHDGELRAVPRRAEEGRAEPAAARERRGYAASAARTRRRRRPGGGGGGRGGAAAADDAGGAGQPAPARTAHAGHGADRFRRPAAAHPLGARRCRARSTRSCRPASPARCSTSKPARAAAAVAARRRRQHAASLPAERSPRRAFVTGVAEYDVSADGRKLVYRARRRRRRRPRRRGAAAPAHRRAVPRRRRSHCRRRPARAASTSTLRMYLEPKAEFKQIFNEGWRNQRDYLYVPNMHGADWPKMKEMYGAVAAVREAPRRSQLPARQHGRRDRDRPLVRARRRHARGAAVAGRPARRRLRDRERPLQDHAHLRQRELESRICARRSPAPGVDVNVGDYILAINGVELRAPDNIYRLLDGTANRQTVLTRERTAGDGGRAAGDRRAGRERAGAAHARVGRRRTAASSTSCRTASSPTSTCRTPGSRGYTSFNRYYFAQQDKKGAVIDERFNGGGSAADYIIDVLQRDFDGYFNNVAGDRVPVHQSRRPASGDRR